MTITLTNDTVADALGYCIINDPKNPLRGLTYEEVIKKLMHSGLNIEYVQTQTTQLCKIAIAQNALSLKHIRNKTQELCDYALSKDAFAIRYVPSSMLTHQHCLNAVSKHADALRWIPKSLRTPQVCSAAVSKKPKSLKYVINQTSEIVSIALQKDSRCVRYVRHTFV